MSERQSRTPPQTTMWPSPPSLSLSTSSAVSPAAMVVLVQSAVVRVREKTTLRPAFRMSANGWSVDGRCHRRGDVLVGGAAHDMRVRTSEKVELGRVVGLSVLGQAEAELPEFGPLVGEQAVERVVEHRRYQLPHDRASVVGLAFARSRVVAARVDRDDDVKPLGSGHPMRPCHNANPTGHRTERLTQGRLSRRGSVSRSAGALDLAPGLVGRTPPLQCPPACPASPDEGHGAWHDSARKTRCATYRPGDVDRRLCARRHVDDRYISRDPARG